MGNAHHLRNYFPEVALERLNLCFRVLIASANAFSKHASKLGDKGAEMLFEERPQDIEEFEKPGFGYIEQPISPTSPGRVHYAGTSWPTQFNCSVGTGKMMPNQRVIVVGRVGINLLIAPEYIYEKCPRKNEVCSRTCLIRLNSLAEKEEES